jgi:hypothetical protein
MSQYWIPLAAITGWALITLYRMHMAGREREHLHRERLAMIEKGLVPPPESDPNRFERMMDWHPSAAGGFDRGARSLRTGLILIAVGIGLALMRYLQAGDALTVRGGLGVGVFLVVIGIAFLLNAMFEARSRQSQPQAPHEKP